MELVLFYSGVIALLLGVCLPLFFVKTSGKFIRQVSLIFNLIACVLLAVSSVIFLQLPTSSGLFSYALSSLISISFSIDKLSAFFVLIISIVSFAVAIYSLSYVEHYASAMKKNLLVSLMNLFVLSMVFVVVSSTMFSFLFFWEVMSLSSFFMVMFDFEKDETKKAGLFYFIMTHLSTAFLMFAFLVLYGATGSVSIGKASLDSTLSLLVFISLFAGFAIKAGAVPFHKWLPYAHPASPSNISALMSGVMIKIAIYGMVRFIIFGLNPELWWGVVILGVGVISAILGVLYAIKEHDIKGLLAYHSIENIGIILMGIGLYIIFNFYGSPVLASVALIAALFHTLNHALFKSLLFLTAGSIVNAAGTRNIEEMGGLAKSMPFTSVLFLIGAISISALPPFNGFVSELMLFQVFLQSFVISDKFMVVFLVASLAIFALTSALAAACFVKAFGTIFLGVPRSEEAAKAAEVKWPMLAGPAVLALFCALLGVFSSQIFSFLGFSFVLLPDLFLASVLLLVFFGLVAAFLFLFASRKTRLGETWGCGISSQNSRMEYTSSGFSEPLLTIFKPVLGTKKSVEREFFDGQKSVFKSGEAGIVVPDFFENCVYMPIVGVFGFFSKCFANMQNGNLNSYIAYVFVGVIGLMLLVWWVM